MSELAAALARRRAKLSETVTTNELSTSVPDDSNTVDNDNGNDKDNKNDNDNDNNNEKKNGDDNDNHNYRDHDNDTSRYEKENEDDVIGGEDLFVEVEEGDELGVKCVPLQYESSTLPCEGLYVIQVKDSSASDFKQGDRIIAVNGHSITDLLIDDALLTLQTSFKRTLSIVRKANKPTDDDKENRVSQNTTEAERKKYDEYLLPTDGDSYSYKYDESSVSHEWRKRKRHYSQSMNKKPLYNGLGEAIDIPHDRVCEPTMVNKMVNKIKPPGPIVDISTDVYHQNMRRLRRRVSKRS
jgi:hypothetical protein